MALRRLILAVAKPCNVSVPSLGMNVEIPPDLNLIRTLLSIIHVFITIACSQGSCGSSLARGDAVGRDLLEDLLKGHGLATSAKSVGVYATPAHRVIGSSVLHNLLADALPLLNIELRLELGLELQHAGLVVGRDLGDVGLQASVAVGKCRGSCLLSGQILPFLANVLPWATRLLVVSKRKDTRALSGLTSFILISV